ncbi:hypothetical protein [Demequina iriomotensis]|uniref:hypothetical protein n=1 Tax=Demequina iriomotensis TaxID=1536641 RepID=UPI000782AAA9|nr:hypothetical protein [Demequina iriomotensis]
MVTRGSHGERMERALSRIREVAAAQRREDGLPPVEARMPRGAAEAVAAARASYADVAALAARASSPAAPEGAEAPEAWPPAPGLASAATPLTMEPPR